MSDLRVELSSSCCVAQVGVFYVKARLIYVAQLGVCDRCGGYINILQWISMTPTGNEGRIAGQLACHAGACGRKSANVKSTPLVEAFDTAVTRNSGIFPPQGSKRR